MSAVDGRQTTAIGAISGTSMDGVDVALIRSDGGARSRPDPARPIPTLPRSRRACAPSSPIPRPAAARWPRSRRPSPTPMSRRSSFLRQFAVDRSSVALVGLHGQTVLHRPRERFTRQLCDGARAAKALGIDVVCDFRSADVAAGGEGAPLAPLYHAAMCADLAKPLTVLNWGGVGNVTYLGAANGIVAFDTGPANALLDDFVARRLRPVARRGAARRRAGRADVGIVAALMGDRYFDRPPPKSLDRNHFHAALARRRTLGRRRRGGDAGRLHRRVDRRGGAPLRGGATPLAGVRGRATATRR